MIEARELDIITVAGKTEPIRIYEAMGRAGELGPERDRAARPCSRKASTAYRENGTGMRRRNHFEGCLEQSLNDGPSRLLLERIEFLRSNAPPADWDGVWRFSEK